MQHAFLRDDEFYLVLLSVLEVALHAASDSHHLLHKSYCMKAYLHHPARLDFIFKNFEYVVCRKQLVPQFYHIQFFLVSKHHSCLHLICFLSLFKILLAHQFTCPINLGDILFVLDSIQERLITQLFSQNLTLHI